MAGNILLWHHAARPGMGVGPHADPIAGFRPSADLSCGISRKVNERMHITIWAKLAHSAEPISVHAPIFSANSPLRWHQWERKSKCCIYIHTIR